MHNDFEERGIVPMSEWILWLEQIWPYLLALFLVGVVVTITFEVIAPGRMPGDRLITWLGGLRNKD